jgi:uncharacterized phage-associated protein
MEKFLFDKEKSISSLLYILNKLGRADFHKIFKILYYADRKHLALYGSPITGDVYIAMKNGPVPSTIYDILKAVKTNYSFNINVKEVIDLFEVHGAHTVTAKKEANLDLLSESDVECLNHSIEDNKELDFFTLSDKSHASAWNSASRDNEISFIEIAKEGGANDAMIDYIKTVSENQRFLSA